MNSSSVRSVILSIGISILVLYLSGSGLMIRSESAVAAPPLPLPASDRRVAVDAGHGGTDVGAEGPTGHLEKTITLESARKLALVLEEEFEVILTRSDDYGMTQRQRTAIANQAKADLFVSIHTGAGFLHRSNAMTVYYYGPMSTGAESTSHNLRRWDLSQIRHRDASIKLARILSRHLENIPGAVGCKMMSAPVLVLEGADMPSVLIEMGHITHPVTEKKLSSPRHLDLLARTIRKGITEYLTSTGAATGVTSER